MKGTEMERTANVPEDLTGRPRRVATGGVSWRNTFSAFQYRNYRLYFCGQLVSLIGTWMTSTAQGWLVYQLTGSKALLGVVAAAGTAPMLVFAAWGGWAADRFPKRSVLLWTQSAMMILAFVFAGLVWSGLIRPWEIIVLGLFGGVAMAFDMPARQSFVVEIASREDLMNAISLNSAMFNGARIVGPAIAGFLMAKVGIALCFFIDGVSFLAVLAGLLMMRLPPQARTRGDGRRARPIARRFSLRLESHPGPDDFCALRDRRDFRLVVLGVDAGFCARCPAPRRAGLRILVRRERRRRADWRADDGDIWHRISSRKLAFGGVWLFSPDAPDLFLQSQPDDCDALPGRHRLRDDAFLFHLQHHGADDCGRRNAGTGDGNLGA